MPYAYNNGVWVGYDNEKSFQNKVKCYFIIYTNFYMLGITWFNLLCALQVQWLKQSGFGGAMVWTLDLDDFSGTFCGQGKYPLINTLKSGLGTGACNICIITHTLVIY